MQMLLFFEALNRLPKADNVLLSCHVLRKEGGRVLRGTLNLEVEGQKRKWMRLCY